MCHNLIKNRMKKFARCGQFCTHRIVLLQIYLPWPKEVPDDPLSGATVISLLVFFSYAIVLNTVVPISLYVR